MKKIIFIIASITTFLTLMGCEDESNPVFTAVPIADSITFTNTSFATQYLLSEATEENIAERFVWTDADFGLETNITYDLQASIDPLFETFEVVAATTENNTVVSVKQLLEFASDLGLDNNPDTTDDSGEPNNTGFVFFRVKAYVGAGTANLVETISTIQTIKILWVEEMEVDTGNTTAISLDDDLTETNYDVIFSEPTDAGFWYDPGTWSGIIGTQLWTWENGADAIANAAVWKNFTDDGTTSGTSLTMAVGDSFKATIQAALSANADVGMALLSSPTSTLLYSDIHNNYAVQVNIDKATNLWEVVSAGGTVDATSITGGTDLVTSFEIVFTLDTATTMTVSIISSDGETETKSITLNNTDITGFSAYVNNNGVQNTGSQIYLIAPMEYTPN